LIIIKNNFAGYIKFSYIKNYHDISIILKDKFRNRSIATSVLKYFRYNKILPFQIKAKVNKQNISSIKTFTKAGFKLNNDLRIIN
jgi:RimJ/RimL family protein N-acetyltransferase